MSMLERPRRGLARIALLAAWTLAAGTTGCDEPTVDTTLPDGARRDGGRLDGGGTLGDGGGGRGDGAGGGGSDATTADRPAPPATDVRVLITADNAYGFGYGDATQLMNYFGGIENPDGPDIFNCPIGYGPEQYTVPAAAAPIDAYLYIITWSDRAVTQGVIGQFQRVGGANVYTGDPGFEVCATGVEYMLGTHGPSMAVINEQIARCNAHAGPPATTSAGWVDMAGTAAGALAVGEDNTTDRGAPTPGNEFPIVCSIDPQAHWMWFNWSPSTIHWPTSGSPFLYPESATDNVTKQFLIFRLGVVNLPPG